jgi:hypothetical protein
MANQTIHLGVTGSLLPRAREQLLSAVPGHPLALVLPALSADAAVGVSGIRTMLEVVPAGCRQGGLETLGPFRVGLSQPPHSVGGQAKIAKGHSERLAAVDHVEELTPQLDW